MPDDFLGVGNILVNTSVNKTDKVPTLILKKEDRQWTGNQTNNKTISNGDNHHLFFQVKPYEKIEIIHVKQRKAWCSRQRLRQQKAWYVQTIKGRSAWLKLVCVCPGWGSQHQFSKVVDHIELHEAEREYKMNLNVLKSN